MRMCGKMRRAKRVRLCEVMTCSILRFILSIYRIRHFAHHCAHHCAYTRSLLRLSPIPNIIININSYMILYIYYSCLSYSPQRLGTYRGLILFNLLHTVSHRNGYTPLYLYVYMTR